MTEAHKYSFGRWSKVDILDLEETVGIVLKDHTVSNAVASGGIFEHIGNTSDTLSILDFGSGVGRNAFPLSEYSDKWNITCYDNREMHEKAKEFAKTKYKKDASDFKNVNFLTDWEEVKKQKYDCIIAVLVFQHIKEEDLNLYLNDIRNMTKKLIVGGRRSLDEITWPGNKKSVWKILEKNGYFPTYCNNQEKYDDPKQDPKDHFICIYEM